MNYQTKQKKIGGILQVEITAALLGRKGKGETCVGLAIYSGLDF